MPASNRSNPVLASALFLVLPMGLAQADEGAPAAPPPTTVSEAAKPVLDRALAAMGGAASIDAVRSVSFDCVMENEQGALTLRVAASDAGVRIEQSLRPPGAEQEAGRQLLITNHSMGWARNLDDDGVRLMPASVTNSVARAADLWNMVRSGLGQFELVEHDGAAVFSGRPCVKLRFSSPRSQGLQQALLYFDDETGLPLGQETATSAGTLVSGIARITEWQVVDGKLVPKRIEVEGQTGQSSLTFSAVDFSAIPASTFEVPSDVQALLGAPSGA